MKKVFKGSLLAASVAMAFAAQAAEVKVAPGNSFKLSEEGLSVGLTENASQIIFDVVVKEQHPATSEIVLSFPDVVDLSAITDGACNAPTTGTFSCGDVTFNVGTGSFTFDNVVVDDAEGTISFAVNLGNALTPDSAFRVTVGDAGGSGNFADISGAFAVGFESNLSGDVIETGSGQIATTAKQFSASIPTSLSGSIERIDRETFVNLTPNDEDSFDVKLTNDTTLLAAATFVSFDTELYGDFSREIAGPAFAHDGKWNMIGADSTPGDVAGVVEADGESIVFAGADVDPTAAGTTFPVEFVSGGIVLDESDFSADVTVNYSDGAAETGSTDLLTDVDAGEWRLNASVVNVPYLPVNYGLTPNVEIANEGNGDAEIIVEAIDNKGNELGPVTLDVIAKGKTVTKVSEADLDEAFGLAGASRKLSVTFIIDADAEDITLAPYYRENDSRVNVMSDQYKGIKDN